MNDTRFSNLTYRRPAIKSIVAVASGKGGVGKSTVAVNLAVALAQQGLNVGLMDADIYGPSIPKMTGTETIQPLIKEVNGAEMIIPIERYGVKWMSIGYFVTAAQPLIWRGAMATNALKQLFNQVQWGVLDVLLIDLPPGTGDIHVSIIHDIKLSGAIIVSTPQAVALADVEKGVHMFLSDKVNVPVLGLVENMAWFTPEELPDNKYYIFGKEGALQLAERLQLPLLAQLPIVQSIRESGDEGSPIALKQNAAGETFRRLAAKVAAAWVKRDE
jgi:ATP-binding protein involved in chromosome partitioning